MGLAHSAPALPVSRRVRVRGEQRCWTGVRRALLNASPLRGTAEPRKWAHTSRDWRDLLKAPAYRRWWEILSPHAVNAACAPDSAPLSHCPPVWHVYCLLKKLHSPGRQRLYLDPGGSLLVVTRARAACLPRRERTSPSTRRGLLSAYPPRGRRPRKPRVLLGSPAVVCLAPSWS
jgi:hypothetical protein